MDAEVDFNNIRRDGFADSDYGSEDSWNDYISLAEIGVVDWSAVLYTLVFFRFLSALFSLPCRKEHV